MAWTTLTLRVTTPLFNGGGDAGTGPGAAASDEGVRVASVRGAMRFWFRALAGALTGPDLELLGAMERSVFGGVGPGDDGARSSPVLLRIPRQPSLVPPAGPHAFLPPKRPPEWDKQAMRVYLAHPNRWILYLMGQGLANLATFEILRPYVPPGQEFGVKVGFRHARNSSTAERAAIEGLAVASLWLACAYGGFGARTRRGFGGVQIIGATGPGGTAELPLPKPWDDPSVLLTPGLGHYERLRMLWPDGPVAACVPYLKTLARGNPLSPLAWGDRIPDFPVLSKKYAPAATSGGGVFGDWMAVLRHAGANWRHFRATEPNNNPTRNYQPCIESPEWINTVHGGDTRFPLGALGLPVGFGGGRDGYLVNADGAGHGDPPRRRASPLVMRVVGENGDYRLLSYAFQSKFLPGGVTLSGGSRPPRPVQVTDDDVKRQTGQWINVMHGDASPDGPFVNGTASRLTGGLGH